MTNDEWKVNLIGQARKYETDPIDLITQKYMEKMIIIATSKRDALHMSFVGKFMIKNTKL